MGSYSPSLPAAVACLAVAGALVGHSAVASPSAFERIDPATAATPYTAAAVAIHNQRMDWDAEAERDRIRTGDVSMGRFHHRSLNGVRS